MKMSCVEIDKSVTSSCNFIELLQLIIINCYILYGTRCVLQVIIIRPTCYGL